MHEFTPAFYVNNLLSILAEHGIDGTPLLRNCAIQPGPLHHADRRIPLEKYFCLIEEAAAVSDISALGLRISTKVPITAHGLLGYTVLSAPTLGGALQRYCRYGAHLGSIGHARLSVDDGEAEVSIRVLRHFQINPVVERYLLMEATGFLTRLWEPLGLGKGWLNRVEMPFDSNGEGTEANILLGCPVVWSCERTKLVFPAELLDCPIKAETILIEDAYDYHCALLLEEVRSGLTMTADINQVIIQRPSNLPDVDEMAEVLGISKRTLQRRLKDEGTNYRDLLLRFRMGFAQFYLENTTLPAAEIGYLIGYTEPVNFYRAFKLFFGYNPSEVRQSQSNLE